MAQKADIANRSTPHLQDQYTKNYCEENIYWLAQSYSKEENNLSSIFVVFISNHSQQVPIWSQRSSSRPDQLAVWDYHVILLALPNVKETKTTTPHQTATIFDLDSSLPSPISLENYVQHALVINSSNLPEMHRRLFRVVTAASYLKNFSSDRSHMLQNKNYANTSGGGSGDDGATTKNSEYMSPPPSCPCIVSANGDTNTFPNYLEMPSFHEAVSNWKTTPLEKNLKSQSRGGMDNGGNNDFEFASVLPYGVVLTEDAFLDFAREAKILA